MKIKICGIKEAEHAEKAVQAGADYLGFVFAPSARQISPDTAREIIFKLTGSIMKVGVFVDEDVEEVNRIIKYCGLDLAQLHGSESEDYCQKISCPVIKAFRVRDKDFLVQMECYRGVVEMFLLDSFVQGKAGGTGKTFDWSLAKIASAKGPVILAGGLTPQNVGDAVRLVNPFAVDVSGGVETNGIKDPVKISEFIKQARRAINV